MIQMRKRSGSNSNKRHKEKIINLYELVFKNEEFQNKDEFWEEFLSCNPNFEHLEMEIIKISAMDQATAVKTNLNLLITQCIKSLDCGE